MLRDAREYNNVVNRMVCDAMLNSKGTQRRRGCDDARVFSADGGATKYFLSVGIPLHLAIKRQ